MKLLAAIFFLLISIFSFAQPYQVGHTTVTFSDASRTGGYGSGGGTGRQIQVEIYYPASVAGEDVVVSSGDFPVIVFGHGFVMSWDAYQNIWEELVPQGYIMVFPRTEGGFSPSHDDFGLDMALCVTEMQALNADAGSLFLNHVNSKSALMGHSMGGGSIFLAAQNNTNIETVIGLAPAETTPSAIAAAAQVLVPAIILSGSSDGVAPPVDHHLPIYNALNVSCKYFINITGGAHCYFANSNFNCDFGESTSSTGISVTRTEQQVIMNDYVGKWLDFKLKSNCTAYGDFSTLLTGDTRISYINDCNLANPVITANGPTSICTGSNVTLSSGQMLDWSNGTSGTSITVSTSGNYSATDPASCAISNEITVEVNPIYNLNSTVTICSGDVVTVGSNTYNTSGIYTDNLISSKGCDSTIVTEVIVQNLPDVTVTQANNVLTAVQTNANYQWIDCGNANLPMNGETNATFTAASNGAFAVIVTSNSCTDTSSCIAVNGLGINTFSSSVSAPYPNPSNGRVVFTVSTPTQLRITDVTGKLITASTLINGSNAVQISDVPGVYFWQYSYNGVVTNAGKILIQ